VLVTGVGGSSNQWQTQQQAYLARKAGVHVVAVGAGQWLDRYEIESVVSQPRFVNAIFADRFSTLRRDSTTSVRNIICNSMRIIVHRKSGIPNLGCRHPLGVSDANPGGSILVSGK